MLNNTTTFGNGNQNLILETAGRVYIKVSDKFYELNFRDQTSNKEPAVINNNIVQKEEADLSNYITKRDLKSSLAQYITKRDWQDVKETQRKLEEALLDGFSESINPITVQTMQVIVGSEQLQFEFIENDSLHPNGTSPYITTPHSFGIQDGRLFCNPGLILHHTVDCPDAVRPGSVSGYEGQQDTKYYCRWHVGNSEVTWFDFDSDEQSYYLYIRAEKLNLTNTQRNDPANDSIKVGNASFFLSAEPYSLDPDDGYYYFLYAIINSDNGDGRSIGTMNGFTEILPGQITAYIFKSADGIQFVDFLNKQFHIGYAPGPGEIATTGTVDNGSYMHWDSHNGLVIKGNITVTGGDLQDTLDDLQRQIDDEVQAWFSSDSNNTNPAGHKHDRPTNNNWPANEWTTDSLKKEHSGDLYYIVDGTYEGETYRYAKVDSSYAWVVVSDSSVAEALRVAYEAMDLAEENEAKLNSWINDGVISPTEISGIREEYEFIQSDYDNLSKEKDLYGLGSSTEWTNYQSAYTLYYNWLNKIIYSYDNADPDVLDEYGNVDLSEVASKYSSVLTDTFANAMSNYYDKRTIFYKHAATTISNGISTAISAAANAQTTADNVTTYVGKSLADDVLSKDEIEVLQTYKKSLADQYTAISSSYTDLIAQASTILQDPDFDHSSSAYINLNAAYLALTTANTGSYAVLSSAYTSLVNSVDAILNCGMTAVGTTDSRLHSLKTVFDTAASTFSTAIAAYIDDVQELNIYIADANKYITIEGYRYLTEAIVNGTTTIAGGLVATNTIVLGNTPQSDGYKITAGINGITTINNVEDTTAIAAWYGGPFRDKSYYYTWDFDDGWVLKPAYISNPPSASDYAQTVFRHNGSGYVAGGAIAWDIDGSGSVANGALYWNASGIPTIASGLEIDLTEGGQLTLLQIANTVALLSSWFVKDTTTMSGKTLLRINMGSQQSTGFDGVIWDGFLVTGGDQIVGSGTPGSGGGGGATYLSDLEDVSDNLQSPSAGAILQYNATTSLWEGNTPATQIGANVSGIATGKLIYDVLGDNFNSNWTVKQFINSSVATATATYRGSYNEKNDLNLNPSATHSQIASALTTVISVADDNDYCFVEIPTSSSTPTEIERTERYKFDGSAWSYEYTLNNSGFTSEQWDAINSGVTSTKISGYDTVVGYFDANGKLGTSHLPNFYLGTTQIRTSSATQDLTGIGNVTLDNAKYLRGYGRDGSTIYNLIGISQGTVSSRPVDLLIIGSTAQASETDPYLARTYLRGRELYLQTGNGVNSSALVLSATQNATLYGALYLQNNRQIYWKNKPAGDASEISLGLLNLTSSNVFTLGSGLVATGNNARAYNTYLYGGAIYFYTGDTTTGATRKWYIESAGHFIPNGEYRIGSSSHYVAEAYTKKIYLASGIYLEYVPASGDTPGYVHLNTNFKTDGDQIIGAADPGGGGGGCSEYLWELEDVDDTLITPSNGVVLQYNATAGEWKGVASDTIGITTEGTVADLNAVSPSTDKRVWSPSVLASWLAGKNYVKNVAIGTGANAEMLAVTRGGATSYLTVPYATNVARFKRYDGTAEAGGYDLNTLLSGGGITSQYNSVYYWANAPTNMSYGGAVQLNPSITQSLAMQLAWDIDHTNVKTGHLWWRDSIYKNSTHTWGDWHLIYDDTTLTKSVITGLLDTGNGTYVKLNPGNVEQTISSNISLLDKGVVNLWRKSGDHYTFLGFSNGTTETFLGGLGFKSQSDNNLYHWIKSGTSSSYSIIYDAGNCNKSDVDWTCDGLTANEAIIGSYTATNAVIQLRNTYGTFKVQAPSSLAAVRIGYGDGPLLVNAAGNVSIESGQGLSLKIKRTTSGAGAYMAFYPGNQDTNYWDIGSSADNVFRFTYDGSDKAYFLTNGTLQTAGDQVITSDIRMKKNLKPIDLKVEDIAKCRAVTFDWVSGGHSFGSIAQDWELILPEAVKDGEVKTLAYGQAALVAAINIAKHETEQDKEIRRLQERVKILEDKVKQLKVN